MEMEQGTKRYKLIVAYDGTRYKGFQRQLIGDEKNSASLRQHKRRRVEDKNGKAVQVPLTIQECIEEALGHYSGLNRVELKVRFAGRTDGGVHAKGQVVVTSLPENLGETWLIRKSINSRLPVDISIEDVSLCKNQAFDPRAEVKRKRYTYHMKYRRKVKSDDGSILPVCSSGPHTIRSGLDPPNVWICPWALDDCKMDEYCQKLTGKHDYSAFVHKKNRRDKDNVLAVEKVECEMIHETMERAPIITVQFVVEAKGFRRAMVRNIVGFLVDVCRGVLEESIFHQLWEGGDDIASKVHSAPACGLCLEHVEY